MQILRKKLKFRSYIVSNILLLFLMNVLNLNCAHAFSPKYLELKQNQEKIQKGALEGNPNDQLLLGYLYQHGDLSDNGYPDYFHAIQYFKKSAEQGNGEAEYALGKLHENGQGLKYSGLLAIAYFRKAELHGNTDAQVAIGELYEKGSVLETNLKYETVEQDYIQSFSWYKKASDQGNADGMYHLATLYDNGRGVRQDIVLASYWYQKAADLGNLKAMLSLGFLSEIKSILTLEKKKKLEAQDLYGKACDGGLEDGCENYARLKNSQLSFVLPVELEIRKRIGQGDVIALYDLGRFYKEKSLNHISKAKKYFSQSCIAGYTKACSAYFE